MCNEADECTQLKDIVNPDIKLENRFSVLENKKVEAGEFWATPNQILSLKESPKIQLNLETLRNLMLKVFLMTYIRLHG